MQFALDAVTWGGLIHAAERAKVRALLGRFQYLGFGGAVGENLEYVAHDGQGQPLACLFFARPLASAKPATSDQFMGWSDYLRLAGVVTLCGRQAVPAIPGRNCPLHAY